MVALIIVSSYLASYFNFILLYHIIALILLLIIVLTFDSWFRKRLLPRGKPKSEIALKLQQIEQTETCYAALRNSLFDFTGVTALT